MSASIASPALDPSDREADVVLRGGSTVHVRPVRSGDQPAIRAFLAAVRSRSSKTFPLLDGYRGAQRCDLAAIGDVLARVSAMVEAHPEIAELDCNPLVALPEGAVIVDARVRVEAVAPAAPMPSLRA